jgi:hypothetical protein
LAQAPLAVRYWTATRHVEVVVVVVVAVVVGDAVAVVLVLVVVAVAVDVEEVAESVVSVAVESVLE